jgi:SET domain-containing protein
MMTIPTFVSESKIHGMGIFSAVDIKKDTIVWQFNPIVDQKFSDNEFLEMCDHMSYENEQKIRSWSYFEGNTWILCGDGAKFFNHSDTPNCKDEIGSPQTVACRDIKAGEEFTANYKDLDEHDRKIEGSLYSDEEEENEDLSSCEQCGENAWDGYICHSCGLKII